MFRRAALAVLVLIGLAWPGAAQTLTFPALTGRVVDEAGLLTASDRSDLTDVLAALEAETTDQLVVVTLKSLNGTTIEDYGYRLGRHWQIGQKDKNNGVLLIVAAKEHKVRIEVGYGLEGRLTDALTRVIIENSILPHFRADDFAGGIAQGAMRIVQVLTGDAAEPNRDAEQGASSSPMQTGGDGSFWPLVGMGVALVLLVIFCLVNEGAICQVFLQLVFSLLSSGGSGSGWSSSSSGGGGFSGGGGSFGGGGSSGGW